MSMSETETVAILKLDSEPGWCAFVIDSPEGRTFAMEEAANLIEGSDISHENDPPLVSLEIHLKPKGWVDSLPEFAGW